MMDNDLEANMDIIAEELNILGNLQIEENMMFDAHDDDVLNDRNSLMEHYEWHHEECTEDAINFHQELLQNFDPHSPFEQISFNIMNIAHNLCEKIFFPAANFDAAMDPEVMFFTLTDETGLGDLFKLRDIGMVLTIRRRPMCDFITSRADQQLNESLRQRDLSQLDPAMKVKLVGAVALGMAAFMAPNSGFEVVCGSVDRIQEEDAANIWLHGDTIHMNYFTGDEEEFVDIAGGILAPIQDIRFHMWRCHTIWRATAYAIEHWEPHVSDEEMDNDSIPGVDPADFGDVDLDFEIELE